MSKNLNHDEVKFPKRRKSNANPYQISYSKKQNSYMLTFKNGEGQEVEVLIDDTLYKTFNQFELEDLSELNEYDRHTERFDLDENAIHNKTSIIADDVEDVVDRQIRHDKLWKAINQLPNIQKRRVVLYYFEELTYEQIAQEEHCSFQAIAYSIETAKKSLKKFLK